MGFQRRPGGSSDRGDRGGDRGSRGGDRGERGDRGSDRGERGGDRADRGRIRGGDMDDQQAGGPRRNNGKRRFERKRVCEYCVGKGKVIDYKNTDELKRYVSEYGRMRPRRQTGTCAKHQRDVAVAVKRARHIALLPFVVE